MKRAWMMILQFYMIVTALFMLNACGRHKQVVYSASKIRPIPHAAPVLDEEIKTSYLDAVNRMRAQPRRCGDKVYAAAKPLQWNDTLYLSSYEHSKDMAICSHFSHNGSGTQSDWTAKTQNFGRCSSFAHRIENNGYLGYRGISENIAYGAKKLETVMQQWIGSEGHCRNIMNPKYSEFGMAKFALEDGIPYWTQNFGTRQ